MGQGWGTEGPGRDRSPSDRAGCILQLPCTAWAPRAPHLSDVPTFPGYPKDYKTGGPGLPALAAKPGYVELGEKTAAGWGTDLGTLVRVQQIY